MLYDAVSHLSERRVWANVLRGRQIELNRESTGLPFDRFGGVLRDPALLAEVQRRLGPEKIWSATQFNDLGLCAFRFFSRRLLRLEPYEEPESGLDALQLGSLNHKILEDTYARIRAEHLTITEENADVAEVILREEAARILETAPQDFGFHAASFWHQEKDNILGKLVRLVRLDFSPDSPIRNLLTGADRIPFELEAAFGDVDASLLEIDGPAGKLLARGFIDRMDESEGQVAIVDYKSGSSTPAKKDMEEGRNYQMLLYLLAARQLLGDDLALQGGLFWSIQSNKEGGKIKSDDEVIEVARESLHRQVLAARMGHFPNQPAKMTNGKCAHYCEFSQFCRVTRASLRKPAEG
jgi:ATP-dependent helicase/DNAse subunit B